MSAHDEFRELAGRILDTRHDIDPVLAEQRAEMAAFAVPAPEPRPSQAARLFYRLGVWMPGPQYRPWLLWELDHDRNFTYARTLLYAGVFFVLSVTAVPVVAPRWRVNVFVVGVGAALLVLGARLWKLDEQRSLFRRRERKRLASTNVRRTNVITVSRFVLAWGGALFVVHLMF